ncbi:MFS transporter [Kitasatospora paracochleata]|uniref:MFS family permease n=1 Tax=Kitasatospora paracochleata TaxID=58354 RepID=A0ABT1JCX0_9ACTN|nr:MFS transporter [Kitasatospora paracochleata]MCP2314561.1 MFS family permease [Kitasatospora paracochleata]
MSRHTLRVLRDRNAGLYLGGVIVSGFGDSAMALAAGIWVKTLTGSAGLAALVGVCLWLPAFAGPVIGTVADRVRRRPLLVATNLVLAAVMTAPIAVRSPAEVWLLFGVLTLVGAGMVLTDAAATALVAAAVPEELRGDFNGLVYTALESMKLLAPLAGAGLFTLYGGPAVAALDAVTFVLAAAAFRFIRVREAPPAARDKRAWATETAEGARYLWRHPVLRPLVLTGGTAMVLSSLSSTATFAMLDTGLHRSAAYAGVLTPFQGLGSVVAGLTAGALMRRMSERAFSAIGLALFALGVLARATPWLPVVLGGSLAIGLGLPCALIVAMTAVQRETPSELLGRVAATANTLMFAPTGPAVIIGAAMVAGLDYRVQLLAAGATGLASAAVLARAGRAPRPTAPDGARSTAEPQQADIAL